MTKVLSIIMLAVFFAVMISVGIRTRKKARSVAGFVLGSRQVGPWITAFAFGTSYFSSGTPDSSDGTSEWPRPGPVLETPSSDPCSPGTFSGAGPGS